MLGRKEWNSAGHTEIDLSNLVCRFAVFGSRNKYVLPSLPAAAQYLCASLRFSRSKTSKVVRSSRSPMLQGIHLCVFISAVENISSLPMSLAVCFLIHYYAVNLLESRVNSKIEQTMVRSLIVFANKKIRWLTNSD